MRVRFWGVRGSIAAPGPETALVGGNTSCVEVECGERRIILDAGTGLRRLGDALIARGAPVEATLLVSHFHWDHIQGLPFFVPAYAPSTKLTIAGMAPRTTVRDALAHQMTAPHFPVDLDDLGARIDWREVRAGQVFDVGDVVVRVAKLNHPGGVLAYRVEHDGQSIVYATDTEHYACLDPVLLQLAEGADVLVYDAQYLPEEYAGTKGRSKVGWGHSTYVVGCEIAQKAGVEKLVLFHHDPTRSDRAVADIEAAARELLPGTRAAREGMVLEVGASVLSCVAA